MRVKTDIFASALMRRVFARGDFAAVERRGADDAGAVFIRQSFRDGTETLFAPAPQSFFDTEDSGDRLFERRLDRVSRSETEAVLEREIRFDPDLWVLALETEDVADLVALSDGEPPPQSAADSLFRR